MCQLSLRRAMCERLLDAQSAAAEHDDQCPQPSAVTIVGGLAHDRDDLLDGWWVGEIAVPCWVSATSTRAAGRCSCAAARAAVGARSAWTPRAGSSWHPGSPHGSSCPSGRCSASSTARPAAGPGRAPASGSSCVGSPPRRACDGASRPPATPRARRRARPRRRATQRHPTPARARQPRHDQHLSARHRHRRDHRHRARPASADDVRHRRTPTLTNTWKRRGRRRGPATLRVNDRFAFRKRASRQLAAAVGHASRLVLSRCLVSGDLDACLSHGSGSA